MTLMDATAQAKLKADSHVISGLNKHYHLNTKTNQVSRKVTVCWSLTCDGECTPTEFKDFSEVSGIKYTIACTYKCSKCGQAKSTG